MLKFNVNSEYKMLYNVINKPLTLFDTSDIYIVYFKTGKGQFSVNNKEYPYLPDSVFVASFTDLCTINPSEESEIYVLEFEKIIVTITKIKQLKQFKQLKPLLYNVDYNKMIRYLF